MLSGLVFATAGSKDETTLRAEEMAFLDAPFLWSKTIKGDPGIKIVFKYLNEATYESIIPPALKDLKKLPPIVYQLKGTSHEELDSSVPRRDITLINTGEWGFAIHGKAIGTTGLADCVGLAVCWEVKGNPYAVLGHIFRDKRETVIEVVEAAKQSEGFDTKSARVYIISSSPSSLLIDVYHHIISKGLSNIQQTVPDGYGLTYKKMIEGTHYTIGETFRPLILSGNEPPEIIEAKAKKIFDKCRNITYSILLTLNSDNCYTPTSFDDGSKDHFQIAKEMSRFFLLSNMSTNKYTISSKKR